VFHPHEWEPIQHIAPVPNDTDWHVIAGTIIVCGAFLSYGVSRNFTRWEAEVHLPEWFSILGECIGILLATLGGALAGYLVWHWGLGLLCGLVGGWASPWVVYAVTRYMKKRTE
jgi:hypothetical protein